MIIDNNDDRSTIYNIEYRWIMCCYIRDAYM